MIVKCAHIGMTSHMSNPNPFMLLDVVNDRVEEKLSYCMRIVNIMLWMFEE